ncbi:MAG: hypothetical protein KBS59_04335 [Clostridiales bacterium]|nr:hypothetical protein [Clostridiales bacterium]
MATFYNRATLSYAGISKSSNIVSGEIRDVLKITKTAVSANYKAGGKVTYVISIVNSGTTDIANITLTDDLGGYTVGTNLVYPLTYVPLTLLYYVNGTLQTSPTPQTAAPLTVTGITVPAGSNVTLVYNAVANEYAPLEVGGFITNEVRATAPTLTNPVFATETVCANNGIDLSISKSVSPASVPENGQITYTFIIQNMGNTATAAGDNVIVSDTFDPPLSNITVTLDGQTLAPNTQYSYNETTGVFATAANVLSVPAATYTQDAATGAYTTTPGVSILTVTGTI